MGEVVKLLRAGQPTPAGFVEVPKGNDRMFKVVLFNRKRRREGTATVWRWYHLARAVKKRFPNCTITPPGRSLIIVRNSRGGKVVAILEPLEGPIKRLQH